ncbi:MAG: exodeoxyribonuclease V subunit gamma [Peptococcaceae bacterium]|nr:exodeoxyribonuclease V subunit gamma [Peptococcaceae bacterium]
MTLRLILGRAGAGKTAACVREIGEALTAASTGEYVLLTPEQATFSNEKLLLASLGAGSGFRVKALSFRRLAHWALQETGGGLLPVLDNVGKSLILRDILAEQEEENAFFARVRDKRGFVEQLAGLIEELRAYQVTPAMLTECVQALGSGEAAAVDRNDGAGSEVLAGGSLGDGEAVSSGRGGDAAVSDGNDGAGSGALAAELREKLADIQRIYQRYEEALGQGWLDLAGELSLLREKLPLWERLPGLAFWLDGFHGFTPAEFRVIDCLLALGRPLVVTLNLPAGEDEAERGEDDLFYPPWETARDLRRLCRKNNYALLPSLCLPAPASRRFAGSPVLAALEASLAADGEDGAKGAVAGAVGAAGARPPYAGLRLSGCGNTRQEVERLAIEIIEAVRDGQARYKDIAVLLRQPETYEPLFRDILPAYGIPYFFDGPKPLCQHPLIALTRELTAILADRWNTGALIACGKTGLAGLGENQVDRLENYCLAWGIQRSHWESARPWTFSLPANQPDDEADAAAVEDGADPATAANRETADSERARRVARRLDQRMERLRQILWRPIARLRQKAAQATDMEGLVTAVYEYLAEIGGDRFCDRQAKAALAAGETELAQTHQRVWRELMELLDQTALFLAAAPPEPALLADVWESGLAALEMTALPPALDQVTICSMDRSRAPLATKVWILGANEGVLPARIREDSLLAAAERQWLAEHEVRLAPDSRRRLFSENYLIYIALTRAAQALYISYPRANEQGESLAPSPLLDRLCRLFPGLTVDEGEPALLRRLARPGPVLRMLGPALRADLEAGVGAEVDADAGASTGASAGASAGAGAGTEAGAGAGTGAGAGAGAGTASCPVSDAALWRRAYEWFRRRPAYRRDLARLEKGYALAPLGGPLPAPLAARLFGQVIKTSITRLERFQACPFAHFLEYGLKLADREEHEVRPPDIGNFFHDGLEALIGEALAQGLSLRDLSEAELDSRVDQTAERLLVKKNHEIFQTSAWYRSLTVNLNRILRNAARTLAYQERQGCFRPLALEAAFGFDEPGSLPPVSLELGGGRQILLRGRIDRIDEGFWAETGQQYLRVLDYKSGGKTLALWEVYYGLKLQLALYLETALAAMPLARPAGLFYFQVQDPILREENRQLLADGERRQKMLMQAQRLHGYLSRDPAVAEMMDQDFAQSWFLPVALRQDGEFTKNSRLLREEDFRALGRRGRRVLGQAGRRLMGGDIALAPYRAGQTGDACAYCPYPSVCRFDPLVPGHRYREVRKQTDEQVLLWLAEQDGEVDNETVE